MRPAAPVLAALTCAGLAVLSLTAAAGAHAQDRSAWLARCEAETDSTPGLNACLEREYARRDADLNRAYQAALRAIRTAEAAPGGARGRSEAVRTLQTAQRRWIEVRDGTCAAAGFLWGGGTGMASGMLDCMILHTVHRTDELRAHVGGN